MTSEPADVTDGSSFLYPPFLLEMLQRTSQRDPGLADKKFSLFQLNPAHPSLGFARKGNVWTVDVGLHYRAIAWRENETVVWFWIGSHENYNKLMNRLN
jgi:hypothetical protein